MSNTVPDGEMNDETAEQLQRFREMLEQRDPASLNRLLTCYRPWLIRLAEHQVSADLRRRLDRSDLVQETLLRGTQQFDQFRGTTVTEFRAWLKQILHNVTKDKYDREVSRKRDVRREAGGAEDVAQSPIETPSQQMRHHELLQQVMAAIDRLNPQQREVVQKFNGGRSFQEIAADVNRSPDAIRIMWGRAVKQLHRMLGGHG